LERPACISIDRIDLLDDKVDNATPLGHGSDSSTLNVDDLPVNLAATAVNVDLRGAEPALALPEVSAGPKEEHNRESKVGLEKALSVIETATGGCNGHEELSLMLVL
jgi:hypothetical protein